MMRSEVQTSSLPLNGLLCHHRWNFGPIVCARSHLSDTSEICSDALLISILGQPIEGPADEFVRKVLLFDPIVFEVMWIFVSDSATEVLGTTVVGVL